MIVTKWRGDFVRGCNPFGRHSEEWTRKDFKLNHVHYMSDRNRIMSIVELLYYYGAVAVFMGVKEKPIYSTQPNLL